MNDPIKLNRADLREALLSEARQQTRAQGLTDVMANFTTEPIGRCLQVSGYRKDHSFCEENYPLASLLGN